MGSDSSKRVENPAGGTGRQARTPDFAVSTRSALRFAGAVNSCEEQIAVGFGDADAAGIVFYPRALALAHTAVENFIRRSPLGWAAWFASPAHAAPIRRAEADFFLPVRAGDTITLRAEVEKIGETSVTFSVDFLNADGRLAIRVRTVHVLIDKETGRSAPLTAEMRRVFGG